MHQQPGILFVLPWHPPTARGADQAVLNLSRAALQHGRLRPLIYCVDCEREETELSEHEGIPMIRGPLRAPLAASHRLRSLAGFMRHATADLRDWRRLIDAHGVRVVHPHHTLLDGFLFALLRRSAGHRLRLLYSVYRRDVQAVEDADAVTRAVGRWMLAQADAVVCCSEDLARTTQQSLRLDSRRLGVIPHGIDVDAAERSRDNGFRPQTGAFDSYLLNVAAFAPESGQDVLLHAYTRLVHRGLRSALVLIGRRTPYLAKLQTLVRQLGLQDHVHFLRDLDHADTLAAIRQARVLAQPARAPSCGLAMLEAGYLETPIVASRAGGAIEILGTYYPYLTKPDDSEGLADSIHEVLFNPTETARQVRLVKRVVSTRFTWGSAYDRHEALWLGGDAAGRRAD